MSKKEIIITKKWQNFFVKMWEKRLKCSAFSLVPMRLILYLREQKIIINIFPKDVIIFGKRKLLNK